tara:strand:+ start:297 stop:491 length:195 start_codon:yes stop_codon:yes gene_type:complete
MFKFDYKAERLSKVRTTFLTDTEHTLLRNIISEVMKEEGTSTDEYEETLNALHTKICLYFMEEN